MEMTPSQLKWQKFAGFVLPMLLGWLLFAWLFGVSMWVMNSRSLATNGWANLLIGVSWLAFFPVTGHAMGIVNAYCWKNQTWVKSESNATLDLVSIFWFLSLPVTLGLICSVIGLLIFPIHLACFRGGQERGKRWVEDQTIEKFLGRKSDWEREESEGEGPS